jgi:Protein of unknown function (DUF2911)
MNRFTCGKPPTFWLQNLRWMVHYCGEGNFGMRTIWGLPVVLWLLLAPSSAQDTQTAYCDYADGSQVSMQYSPSVKGTPKNGQIWSPGITLFVQVPLRLGSSEIPIGAYTVHLIPDKKSWTLIVNKDVRVHATYNPSSDVARAPMELGEIPDPTKQLQLSFAHMSAKQCSLRVYYAKVGAFTDFLEK